MTCRWKMTKTTTSLLVGMACVALAAGCRHEAEIAKTPTPVRTTEVQLIDAGTSNTYSANIQPYQQVDLAFKSNGYLASIKQVKDADGHVRNIDIGDYVTQGTVLATVQEDEFKDKLAQAKASLERSQAENEKTKLSYERTSKLFAVGAATKPDLDDVTAQVASTSAAVANSKAQVAEAQLALGYCELRAPFSGWVLEAECGRWNAGGTGNERVHAGGHTFGEGGVWNTGYGNSQRQAGERSICDDGGAAGCLPGTHYIDIGFSRSKEPRVFGRGAH